MTSAQAWEAKRNTIRTHKGGWVIGKGVMAGEYSLLDDLLGTHKLTDVIFLHCTGRLPEHAFSIWVEGMFICLAFPDPRIWCNQISALAGNSGCTPTAGIATGTMAGDSSLYGPGCTVEACGFIQDASEFVANGAAIEEFLAFRKRKGKRTTPGFARPIAHGDARVDALLRLAHEVGLQPGAYTLLAEQLGARIGGDNGNAMNMLGLAAAFLMDNGMNITEINRVFSLCVMAGTHACFSEAADSPRGSFLPLRCDDIEYTGVPARAFPAPGEPR